MISQRRALVQLARDVTASDVIVSNVYLHVANA